MPTPYKWRKSQSTHNPQRRLERHRPRPPCYLAVLWQREEIGKVIATRDKLQVEVNALHEQADQAGIMAASPPCEQTRNPRTAVKNRVPPVSELELL